ncbi:MAG: S8 family serine peptidase [Phycisphaerales bacterium]
MIRQILTVAAIAAAATVSFSDASLVQGRQRAVQAQPRADYAYRYFEETKPLVLDPSRIAVFAPSAAQRESLAARIAALDLAGAESGILFEHGWSSVKVPEADRNDAGIARLVRDIPDPAGAVAFASPVFLDEHGGEIVMTQDVFVGFDDGVAAAQAQAIIAGAGIGAIVEADYHGMPGVYKVHATSSDGFEVLAQANAMANMPGVRFAAPNRVVRVYPDAFIPNDPNFGITWPLQNDGGSYNGQFAVADMDMDGPEAWDITVGSASIVVAVIDEGVQQNHPDLNQVTPGFDETGFGTDGGPVFGYDNHGTSVAGCIAGKINNALGTCGIAPGCRIRSFKVAYDTAPDPAWTSQDDWIANGVLDAWGTGCRITNSSFGVSSAALITNAYNLSSAFVVHFASAGNGGADGVGDPTLGYPASLTSVQAVAALDPDGTLTSFSNYGTGLKYSAPGSNCYTTDRTGSPGYSSGDYTWFSGTSAASPYAAGVAALILSADPSLNPSGVIGIMDSTCVDRGAPGYDTTYGWGFVNAYNAAAEAAYGDVCGLSGNCYASHAGLGCSDFDCCAAVCAQDSFCCATQWDGVCADEAIATCTTCGSPSAGSCYESNGSPSCNDATCCAIVCELDGFCCNNTWDGICANEADDNCAPENDNCSNAITITDGVWAFDNIHATTDGLANGMCNFFGDNQIYSDVWYRWTAPCTGVLTVSTCGTATFDTKIAVYGQNVLGGCGCPGTNPFTSAPMLACADDTDGCSGNTTTLSVNVTAGDCYKIRIGSYSATAQGSGTFVVSCVVPNDNCGDAIPISNGVTSFSNIGATTDGPANATCNFSGYDQIGADVWYLYTATCTGPLTISTCGTANFDTKIAIYGQNIFGSCGCPGGLFGAPILGCNDDASGCAGFTSSLTVDVTAGKCYRIRVGGYQGAQGSGTLSITCGACVGDINGDGQVNAVDLGALLGSWGGPGAGDLNNNGITDAVDLGLLLGNWGPC